jgi:hypothetical protein
MKTCIINGNAVALSLIGVDAHAFGRMLPKEHALPYSLKISTEGVLNRFGKYYEEYIERESEDENIDEEIHGNSLLLKNADYPSLEVMLTTQPELLSRILLNNLPTEFMGYMFLHEGSAMSKMYILQTLTTLEISNNEVKCTGTAFINPAFQPNRA